MVSNITQLKFENRQGPNYLNFLHDHKVSFSYYCSITYTSTRQLIVPSNRYEIQLLKVATQQEQQICVLLLEQFSRSLHFRIKRVISDRWNTKTDQTSPASKLEITQSRRLNKERNFREAISHELLDGFISETLQYMTEKKSGRLMSHALPFFRWLDIEHQKTRGNTLKTKALLLYHPSHIKDGLQSFT